MAEFRSTDRLIPVPEAEWAQVWHGDCTECRGEVLITDLLRLRESAVVDVGHGFPREWVLWRGRDGNWHAHADLPGTGLMWWDESVTYRGD